MTKSSMIVNLCNQRTGSKFFGSCLRAGADIVPLGEIFNPDSGQALTFWSWLQVNGTKEFGNHISTKTLDMFFDGLYTQFGPFHFDLMYNQISAITPSWTDRFGFFILDYLRQRQVHVVHTVRDPKDIFISLTKLAKSGVAHARAGETQVELDEDALLQSADFVRFRDNYLKWQAAVQQDFLGYERFFCLDFEQLVAQGDRLPEALVGFLSEAVRQSGPEYGDHIQVRGALFGKAPQVQVPPSAVMAPETPPAMLDDPASPAPMDENSAPEMSDPEVPDEPPVDASPAESPVELTVPEPEAPKEVV